MVGRPLRLYTMRHVIQTSHEQRRRASLSSTEGIVDPTHHKVLGQKWEAGLKRDGAPHSSSSIGELTRNYSAISANRRSSCPRLHSEVPAHLAPVRGKHSSDRKTLNRIDTIAEEYTGYRMVTAIIVMATLLAGILVYSVYRLM
jgi:hypothetical protein